MSYIDLSKQIGTYNILYFIYKTNYSIDGVLGFWGFGVLGLGFRV